MSELFYGVGPVPKGKRRANMKEAVMANQIRYFGLNKIDPILVASVNKLKKDANKRQKEKEKLMVKIASLLGKKKNITSKINYTHDKTEKKELGKSYTPTQKLELIQEFVGR